MTPDNRIVCLTENRPYFVGRPCKVCRAPLGRKDRVAVWEIETNEFRGDDEVYVCHLRCEAGMSAALKDADHES